MQMSSNSLRRVFWKWYCERVQALERSVRLLTDFNELTKSAKALLTVGKAKRRGEDALDTLDIEHLMEPLGLRWFGKPTRTGIQPDVAMVRA